MVKMRAVKIVIFKEKFQGIATIMKVISKMKTTIKMTLKMKIWNSKASAYNTPCSNQKKERLLFLTRIIIKIVIRLIMKIS